MTRRAREQAALLLSACASYGEAISVARMAEALFGLEPNDGYMHPVARLAVKCWGGARVKLDAVNGPRMFTDDSIRDDYAEAECLLRTGAV